MTKIKLIYFVVLWFLSTGAVVLMFQAAECISSEIFNFKKDYFTEL